jgi:hypothetical protein
VYRCRYNPKHVPIYLHRLKVAERYRGGETYSRYGFNEPFCALLFRLRVGQIKCTGGTWYQYDRGVWQEKTRHKFRPNEMRSIHPRHREAKRITQVLDYVESACQLQAGALYGAYKRVDSCILINVENGILEIGADRSVNFGPHLPDHFFTLKIPTSYLPLAKCPQFEDFLRQALPDARDRVLLRAFAGYLLFPGCELETALVCVGSGGTGKSTTWEAIKNVLGSFLCGSASLEPIAKVGVGI